MSIIVKSISSLEKVFLDEELKASEYRQGSALRGERFSFQIACGLVGEERVKVSAQIQCPLNADIELFEVGQVPVTFPAFSNHDKDYLRSTPGLFPDPLYLHKGEMNVINGQWRCLWVSVVVPEDATGSVPITVGLYNADKLEEQLAEVIFQLDVIAATLPKQRLFHTEWFHVDCLATWYNVEVFSEEHWNILKNYMSNAAQFGVNMLLTPIFTPPLDTQVGGDRPTVQLVDVILQNGQYSFQFDRLTRYMELAEQCGILYFEISHLFTQWGAKFAPKVIAIVDGKLKQIFGWETDAGSYEFVSFLNAFLKELRGASYRLWAMGTLLFPYIRRTIYRYAG